MKKMLIKPYGDKINDGMVQLSFTLPVPFCEKAKKAAELYVSRLNFEEVSVVHSKEIGKNFTYFIVYAKAIPSLDYSTVSVKELQFERMGFNEINKKIKNELHRKIYVIGATIGTDAHTLGIDAIMNMKGYNHDYGLERYPEIKAINMGAQVTCEELIEKAIAENCDAILISQTVTQSKSHLKNYEEFIGLLKAKKIKKKFILIAGGSRITNESAVSLGFDAGFGPGTLPSQVASFIVNRMTKKNRSK